MSASAAARGQIDRLKLKALGFRALAAPFAHGPSEDTQEALSQAAACFELLGWKGAALEARTAADAFRTDAELAGQQYSQILHRALPSPYETSYSPTGGPNDLADIAGFYRAFGVRIEGDRPDHVAAELEYLAFMLIREAYASERGERENATVCEDARRGFIRDHLGCWLGAFSARIGESSPGVPFERLASAAQMAVAADAAELHVEPRPIPVVAGGDPWTMPGPPASPDEPACAPVGEDLPMFP